MYCWSSTQSVCCSCRYWGGSRVIDAMAMFFEAKEDKGICNGPDGSFRGIEMSHSSGCSAWEKYR